MAYAIEPGTFLNVGRCGCAELPGEKLVLKDCFEPTVFGRKNWTMEIREKTAFGAMRYLSAGTRLGEGRGHSRTVITSPVIVVLIVIKEIIEMCLRTVGLANLRKIEGERKWNAKVLH